MARKLLLEVVNPERLVRKQSVDYVDAPGLLGGFGILPGHVPFLSARGIGNMLYQKDGRLRYLFVAGGFAEVSGGYGHHPGGGCRTARGDRFGSGQKGQAAGRGTS